MDWLEILNQIFQVCLVPLLGILVTAFLKMIQTKKTEIINETHNDIVRKYVELLAQTISECIMATNQTYVDELKEKNAFDESAQKEALQKTYEAIMAILSEQAIAYLEMFYGDLQTYILTKIEAEIRLSKN